MADEVNLQFLVPGQPEHAMERWRNYPSRAIEEGDFELIDQSYNSLVYKARYMDWPQKILLWTTFGVALLFKGFMYSTFTLTVRFDAQDDSQTRVTIIGTAHPRTRAALGELAAERGGAIGLRVGV